MALTTTTDVADQIGEKWSPVFMNELRESFILPNLVSKEFEGEIKGPGDIVHVSQINAPTSTLRTIGTDADSFSSNKLSTSTVALTVNKLAVSAYKFENLVQIQSIINPANNPKIRQAMMHDVGSQINTFLYSLLVPSTSTPDHTINSQATFTNALMATMREDASLANWPKSSPWYALFGANYYSDFLADGDLASSVYNFSDPIRSTGVVSQKRYGFDCFEDSSMALGTQMYAFVPEAIIYGAQTEPTFEISSLHSNEQFGFVMSVSIAFGAILSIDGAKKCYTILST